MNTGRKLIVDTITMSSRRVVNPTQFSYELLHITMEVETISSSQEGGKSLPGSPIELSISAAISVY